MAARPGTRIRYVSFYHDVPRKLAVEAVSKERGQSATPMNSPWPLDAWPDVQTKFVLCRQDRFFPADFPRRLVAERLNITPDEIEGSHCLTLSRPKERADILAGYARQLGGGAPESVRALRPAR